MCKSDKLHFQLFHEQKFVFKNKEGIAKTAAKYFLLAALILAANTIMLELCVKYLIHNKYISKILIEVLLFFISWAAQKVSFSERGKEKLTNKTKSQCLSGQ